MLATQALAARAPDCAACVRSATLRDTSLPAPEPSAVITAHVRAAHHEVAGQIERAYPGYHVWISDAGWWYATRTHSWARGQSATVHGPGPGELTGALAAEEAAVIGCAMTGAW